MRAIDELKAVANEFAESSLRGYIDRLRDGRFIQTVQKEVNDPVWGTIKLDPLEVLILDSPILQRLRLIRQLGVVHWVYPAATHSRFEHTLGVLHQSQQLINAINLAAVPTGSGNGLINDANRAKIRFCAVLHDIGHPVFSHVSEHALMRHMSIKQAVVEFGQENGKEKLQLSELMAYLIVGSPAFMEMLEAIFDRVKTPLDALGGVKAKVRDFLECCQKAIIGTHIDEELPLLHEIISGPFDADKLDYYSRDAMHAGIPSILDISRLIQKITVRETPNHELPEGLAKKLEGGRDKRWLFGLKSSGASILDELHLARVLLYSKIYRHKKVQAIEAMVQVMFEHLEQIEGIDYLSILRFAYEVSDDQLLTMSGAEILARVGAEKSDVAETMIDTMAQRLRERNLFVVSFALRDKQASSEASADTRIDEFREDASNTQSQKRLKNLLVSELLTIPEDVQQECAGEAFANLSSTITIAHKSLPDSGTVVDHALVMRDGIFVRGSELPRFNRSAWADAFKFDQPGMMIFAPREIAGAVFLATEKLLAREYDAVQPQVEGELPATVREEVATLREKLDAAGWYAGTPIAIRPVPLRLRKADVTDRAKSIADKLAVIDEPRNDGDLREMTAGRVVDWLAQFRNDRAIEQAMDALERFKVLGRVDVKNALEAFAAEHPEFKGATICPFGDAKDSASIITYLSQDLTIFSGASTLQKAAEREVEGPIIFFDDFTASGGQALDQLGAWFDIKSLKQNLGEERFAFNAVEQKYLKSRKVAFVFVAGWNAGLVELRKAANEAGLDATVYAEIGEDDLPTAFDSDEKNEFLQLAEKIGASLLASKKVEPKKIKERSLGYGNRALLIGTRYNIPAQTLTCLWSNGEYDGIQWNPLVKRRKKQ